MFKLHFNHFTRFPDFIDIGSHLPCNKRTFNADRVQALDYIGINLIASIAIFSILLHTHAYFDLILLVGILSFVGTIAFSRYVERGVVIERNSD